MGQSQPIPAGPAPCTMTAQTGEADDSCVSGLRGMTDPKVRLDRPVMPCDMLVANTAAGQMHDPTDDALVVGADGKIKVCIGGGKVENDILRFCFLTKCFSRVFSKYSHFYDMQLMLPDISISSLIFSNHILISFIECLILFSIYTGAGFIGSHIAKKLKEEGCYVICADWNDNEFWFCSSKPNVILYTYSWSIVWNVLFNQSQSK
jgi:hypothetical protein